MPRQVITVTTANDVYHIDPANRAVKSNTLPWHPFASIYTYGRRLWVTFLDGSELQTGVMRRFSRNVHFPPV